MGTQATQTAQKSRETSTPGKERKRDATKQERPAKKTRRPKHNTHPNAHTAERHASLSRRNFLRGLGACVALPTFESLHPLSLLASPAIAAEAGQSAPVRMAFLYVPNGTIPSSWWPEGDGGKAFELSRTLQP